MDNPDEFIRICKNPACRKTFIVRLHTKGRWRLFHSDKCRDEYFAEIRRQNQINDAKAILNAEGYFMNIIDRMKETTIRYIIIHDLEYKWDKRIGSWVKK